MLIRPVPVGEFQHLWSVSDCVAPNDQSLGLSLRAVHPTGKIWYTTAEKYLVTRHAPVWALEPKSLMFSKGPIRCSWRDSMSNSKCCGKSVPIIPVETCSSRKNHRYCHRDPKLICSCLTLVAWNYWQTRDTSSGINKEPGVRRVSHSMCDFVDEYNHIGSPTVVFSLMSK